MAAAVILEFSGVGPDQYWAANRQLGIDIVSGTEGFPTGSSPTTPARSKPARSSSPRCGPRRRRGPSSSPHGSAKRWPRPASPRPRRSPGPAARPPRARRLISRRRSTNRLPADPSSGHTRGVAGSIIDDPRLAEVYDPLDPDRSDLDVYIAMVEELGLRRVLDVAAGRARSPARWLDAAAPSSPSTRRARASTWRVPAKPAAVRTTGADRRPRSLSSIGTSRAVACGEWRACRRTG